MTTSYNSHNNFFKVLVLSRPHAGLACHPGTPWAVSPCGSGLPSRDSVGSVPVRVWPAIQGLRRQCPRAGLACHLGTLQAVSPCGSGLPSRDRLSALSASFTPSAPAQCCPGGTGLLLVTGILPRLHARPVLEWGVVSQATFPREAPSPSLPPSGLGFVSREGPHRHLLSSSRGFPALTLPWHTLRARLARGVWELRLLSD